MKIKSPLINKKEAEFLCQAGADELFCGVEPHNWRRRYKDFCINQRPTWANFTKLTDLEDAIQIAHRYKTKVHVAMNAFFHLEEQYEMAQSIIKDIIGIGADGIIFADPILLASTDKDLLRGKDIIIGCDAVIFNSASTNFFKKLGVTRIVLPRSMTIREVDEVIKCDASLEYEVFIIHDLCFFEDGLCAFCKEKSGKLTKEGKTEREVYFYNSPRLPDRGAGLGCRSTFSMHKMSLMHNRKIKVTRRFSFWDKKHIEGCGACAIYDFKKIGVTSLKVLDRKLPIEDKIKATVFIKKSLELLENDTISNVEYRQKCRALFNHIFKTKCNQYDCYYP